MGRGARRVLAEPGGAALGAATLPCPAACLFLSLLGSPTLCPDPACPAPRVGTPACLVQRRRGLAAAAAVGQPCVSPHCS